MIHSEEDALRYADLMLASLRDEFTCLYDSDAEARVRQLGRSPSTVTAKHIGKIGYVRISDFMSEDVDWQLQRALSRLVRFEGLILDLRGNFGGKIEAALNCSQLLLAEGALGYVKQRVSRFNLVTLSYSITQAERIVAGTSSLIRRQTIRDAQPRRLHYALAGKPLVVLVDSETASAAEMLAQALQDHGVIVIGERTVGKGIGQNHISLNGVAVLQITGCRYYSPRGHWLGDAQEQRFGVTPDIIVPAALSDSDGSDPEQDIQLQEALRYLSSVPSADLFALHGLPNDG
jgi:carboxyl-terminal processing protease